MTRNAVIIGATGDVGTGMVKALLADGFRVVAMGRNQQRLEALRTAFGVEAALETVTGSIASEELAHAAAERVRAFGAPSVVIVSVSGQAAAVPLVDLSSADLARVFGDDLLPHLIAAKAFLPILSEGGVYLGIGGGMADLTVPGMAAISMAQAAQRALFRYLAKEPAWRNVHVRELMLYSMIAGKSKAAMAEPHWITADEVGQHVRAILADLATFEGPVLTLKSRKQVGQPERKAE